MAERNDSGGAVLAGVLSAAQGTAMPSELVALAEGKAEVLQQAIRILQRMDPTRRTTVFALANLRSALEITRF